MFAFADVSEVTKNDTLSAIECANVYRGMSHRCIYNCDMPTHCCWIFMTFQRDTLKEIA